VFTIFVKSAPPVKSCCSFAAALMLTAGLIFYGMSSQALLFICFFKSDHIGDNLMIQSQDCRVDVATTLSIKILWWPVCAALRYDRGATLQFFLGGGDKLDVGEHLDFSLF